MPELNQPIFRSNAIKHYMEGREKHEFPRFMSLPITILLWILLTLFVVATIVVWSEQVPIYTTIQGIVVAQSTAQTSGKSAPTSEKPTPTSSKAVLASTKPASVTGKSASRTAKSVPAPIMAVFFFPPAQAQNLHAGMPIGLNIGSSGQQLKSQITSIEPGVMSPAALSSLFHLGNIPFSITQPSMVVVVKLDSTFATKYAGSMVTGNLQVGSQRLISFLPGVGSLFGN